MDIERLKELREEVFEDYKAYMVKNLKDEDGKVYPSTVPLDECSPIGKDLLKLIDEAIARQSVKSEEAVRDAIEWLTNTGHSNQYMSGEWTAPMRNHITRKIQDTIITALQAYQPTTRKDRTVEEVAISKTETTSCEWCEGGIDTASLMDADMMMRFVRPVNYCPNCGRPLPNPEERCDGC